MTPAKENDWVIASDGIRARKNGIWGKEKLSFLDEFVPAALQATGTGRHPKKQRWYIDLFAGPGRNADTRAKEEFEGSAIRVLPMSAQSDDRVHFTHAVLVNKDAEDQAALKARVDRLNVVGRCPVIPQNLEMLTEDANQVVHHIMRRIDPNAYVLAFADITRPTHWPWTSVKALKAHGHKSVDFYMLFPSGMALQRMLSYNDRTVEESSDVLDAFFGTEVWREFIADRKTDAQSPELRRRVLDLYVGRLRSLGWAHVLVAREIKRTGDALLYHMLYASNHPAGGRIAKWSATRTRRGEQRDFFG